MVVQKFIYLCQIFEIWRFIFECWHNIFEFWTKIEKSSRFEDHKWVGWVPRGVVKKYSHPFALRFPHTQRVCGYHTLISNFLCGILYHTLILQGRLIASFFVWRFCSCSGLLVRIPGLFCVRGILRIFIEGKLSNLSALLVLSPVNM